MTNEQTEKQELKRYHEDCNMCDTVKKTGGPSHNGSRFCKSGSIASGGNRPHCTCDSCF